MINRCCSNQTVLYCSLSVSAGVRQCLKQLTFLFLFENQMCWIKPYSDFYQGCQSAQRHIGNTANIMLKIQHLFLQDLVLYAEDVQSGSGHMCTKVFRRHPATSCASDWHGRNNPWHWLWSCRDRSHRYSVRGSGALCSFPPHINLPTGCEWVPF